MRLRVIAVLKHELPLIAFTTFSPAAVGVVLACLIYRAAAYALGVRICSLEETLSIASFVLVTAGMVASVLHLAKPLRAPFSLIHWRESRLSREIIAVSFYWVVTAIWVICAILANMQMLPVWASIMLSCIALASGCVLIAAISAAYMVNGQPAWRGKETVVELAACAIRTGVPIGVIVVAAQLLSAGYSQPVALSAVGCFASLAASIAAYVLDGHAASLRVKRLSSEDHTTRVGETLKRLEEWSPDRAKAQVIVLVLGIAFSVATLFSANYIGLVVCILLGIGLCLLQIMLRVCFYGLFTTARTVPRFPGIS